MGIGFITATLLNITMVDYIFSTQGYLKNLFQGKCKEKIFKTFIKTVSYIHIKLSLLYYPIVPPHPHPIIPTHTSSKHTTTLYLFVSILKCFSYFFTLWSYTPSTYIILRLIKSYTTQYYSLLHSTKPNSY